MKKVFVPLLFLVVMIVVSCNKEEDSQKGYFSMDVNGVNWTAKNEVGAFIQSSNKKLVISCNDLNKKHISIGMNDIEGVGTYDMNEFSGNLFSFYDENPSTRKSYNIWQPAGTTNRSHGTLTITNILSDKSGFKGIEGTFSGVAYSSDTDSIVITNGKFKDAD